MLTDPYSSGFMCMMMPSNEAISFLIGLRRSAIRQ